MTVESITLQNIEEFGYAMKESLRALKTNLQFCGDDVRVIMLTSCTPDEGKSTVCFDLARSLTDSGKRVLLVDADMRKSVLIKRLKVKQDKGMEIRGLSHLLSGQRQADEVIYSTNINRLYMIFSGPPVPNPTEILEKKYFDKLIELARDNFDYVLIDCPPLGVAIDAAIIAKACDGAMIIVEQGGTSKRMVSGVKRQLENAGVRILGAVLNKCKTEKTAIGSYYSHYYGKYYGTYYGNLEGNDTAADENAKVEAVADAPAVTLKKASGRSGAASTGSNKKTK